ncbi:MAG: hypothetical protein LBL81_01030 [Tannerella sp.]|jgi:hypothetical protein|nr:hypothetical protein [Tannerella sp.]
MMRGSQTDELMTMAFMLLAIAAGACYLATWSKPHHTAFFIVGGLALALRIVQYALRFFK